MSLGVFVGGQVLAELCGLKVPLSLILLSLMNLRVWASARYRELQDNKMMITGGDILLMFFILIKFAFLFLPLPPDFLQK